MRRVLVVFAFLLILGSAVFFVKDSLFVSKEKTAKVVYPATEQKPFVIVIPSYNNEKYIEKNLRSVFAQEYDNYRVIYIDDHSNDDTLEQAKRYITELDHKKRTTLIHNPANNGALANIYNAVHSCHDHEIIILLDGDDFFAHEHVLTILNQNYANPNVWMTYGNYLDYPSYTQNPRICKKLNKKIIKKRTFRSSPWATTHLRTFYASLFKEIALCDLTYRGRFYPMSWDIALMIPLLEMAAPNIAYIDDILYLYNRANPISDHKLNLAFQKQCHEHICTKPPYSSLHRLPTHVVQKQTADLIIFSEDRPMQAYALLESITRFVTGLKKITVLYQTSSPKIESLYLDIQLDFPQVHFVKMENALKPLIHSIAFDDPFDESPYILFAKDTLIVNDFLDLYQAIHTLELSQAQGIYFSHHLAFTFSKELQRHLPIPPCTPLRGIASQEIPFAWQFSSGVDDWNSPNPLSFALYRKEDVKKILENIDFDTQDTLQYEWANILPQEKIGLFYGQAKCVYLSSLPLLSDKDFLEKFTSGCKIDLAPLFQINSPSQEICINLDFVPRN